MWERKGQVGREKGSKELKEEWGGEREKEREGERGR